MQEPSSIDSLSGGFTHPPVDAAIAFRSLMQAMAQPGNVYELSGATPPAPLSVAAGATVLTLCDTETPVYLAGRFDCADVRQWITFHTGAPFSDARHCHFALGAWADLVPLSQYPTGAEDYPDRSATLIVESNTLEAHGATLQGPGIQNTAKLSLPDISAFRWNNALYPLGLDFFFTCLDKVAALPRSTTISSTLNSTLGSTVGSPLTLETP